MARRWKDLGQPELTDEVVELLSTATEQRFADRTYDERVVARDRAQLAVLAARGLPLEDAQRREIEAARDKLQLDAWIARAAVVGSTVEVLAKKTGAARKPSRRLKG